MRFRYPAADRGTVPVDQRMGASALKFGAPGSIAWVTPAGPYDGARERSRMLMSRMDRVVATARLLPTAPAIGVVVVLQAFGLAPSGVQNAQG